MELNIRLFADFRRGRFVEERRHYPDGTPIQGILDDLHIEMAELGIVMIDKRRSSADSPLADGQTLALFPVVGGG